MKALEEEPLLGSEAKVSPAKEDALFSTLLVDVASNGEQAAQAAQISEEWEHKQLGSWKRTKLTRTPGREKASGDCLLGQSHLDKASVQGGRVWNQAAQAAPLELPHRRGRHSVSLSRSIYERHAVQESRRVVADFVAVAGVATPAESIPSLARMSTVQWLRRDELAVSPRWTALKGDLTSWRPTHAHANGNQTDRVGITRSSVLLPRLALDKSRHGMDFATSDRTGALCSNDRIRWPGSIVEVPPLPTPPETHPLLTPRTGAVQMPKQASRVPKLPLALAGRKTACSNRFQAGGPDQAWPFNLHERSKHLPCFRKSSPSAPRTCLTMSVKDTLVLACSQDWPCITRAARQMPLSP